MDTNHSGFVDRNEMKISTSEDGKIKVQTFAVNSASRDMIAELMIIYNYHVAEFCYKNQIPAAYRTQEQPQIERAYGIVGDPLAWYLTSRHLKKARISMRPETHSGLGLNKYTQASSPIRRYSDLKLQRQLVHYLKTGRPKFSNEEIKYGVCKIDKSGHLKNIIEKPNFQHLLNTGFYILNKNCVSMIPKNKEYNINSCRYNGSMSNNLDTSRLFFHI